MIVIFFCAVIISYDHQLHLVVIIHFLFLFFLIEVFQALGADVHK